MENPQGGADGAWDRWFRRFVAIVCLGLLVFEAVVATSDRPYLLGALVVLIAGAPIAVVVDAWLGRRRGS